MRQAVLGIEFAAAFVLQAVEVEFAEEVQGRGGHALADVSSRM